MKKKNGERIFFLGGGGGGGEVVIEFGCKFVKSFLNVNCKVQRIRKKTTVD